MPGKPHKPFRVAVTGGIASGKSTITEAFARRGVPVIDADELAREVTAPGSAGLHSLIQTLGSDILDTTGKLDRRRMRALIFADPEKRKQAEDILHPLIGAELERRANAESAPYVILAIPLLAETGMAEVADRILVVDCPAESQIDRLMARDGESRASAERMLAAQTDRETRLALADDVLVNDGPRDALIAQVAELDHRYREMASRPLP